MLYKFIFIDDEELLRKNLPFMADWNSLGFEFSGAFSNVDDALSFVAENPVNLVLSDIRLGEKSGLDLAKTMSEVYPEILVGLISAYKEFEYAKKAIEYQVFEYITKPIDLTELESICGIIAKYGNILPTVEDGVVYLPVRAIAEAAGAEVIWDGQTGTIAIVSAESKAELKIGSEKAIVDGEEVTLAAAPKIVDDRTVIGVSVSLDKYGFKFINE